MNNKQRSVYRSCGTTTITCIILLNLWGCGGPDKPDGLPVLYPCKVTITQEGKPLDDAIVQLHGVNNSVPWTVNGVTDRSGGAVIKTQTLFAGAPEGQYVVTVTKKVQDKSQLPASPPKDKQEAEKWYDAKESERLAVHSFVSPEFTSPVKTTLRMTVTSNSKQNTETFDVGPPVDDIVM